MTTSLGAKRRLHFPSAARRQYTQRVILLPENMQNPSPAALRKAQDGAEAYEYLK